MRVGRVRVGVLVGVARAATGVGRAVEDGEVELHELGLVLEPADAPGRAHVGPEREPDRRLRARVVRVDAPRDVGRRGPPRRRRVVEVAKRRRAEEHRGAQARVAVARDEVRDARLGRLRLDEPRHEPVDADDPRVALPGVVGVAAADRGVRRVEDGRLDDLRGARTHLDFGPRTASGDQARFCQIV